MSEIMEDQYLSYLDKYKSMALATTTGAGDVGCATVLFARDDDGRIYFSANKHTRKVRRLGDNPRVAIALSDDQGTRGVQIAGTAEQLGDGPEVEKARRLLIDRHPQNKKYFDDAGSSFFRVSATERVLINFAWGIDWRRTVM